MFALPGMERTLAAAQDCDLVYFSLISLAVIGDAGREALLGLARARKAAGRAVAYDSNYRPRLWPDAGQAQAASLAAAGAATIGLPTNVDERELFADAADEPAIAARWHAAGCDEVIVKAGSAAVSIPGRTARRLSRLRRCAWWIRAARATPSMPATSTPG